MSNQKLELTWIGKNDNKKIEPRILIEDKEKSYGDKNTGNMLIHGDNLLALKALEGKFTNRIKCIYIDPPYNTGSAFEHYDDNLEHSIWLNLMKQRLEILKKLLAKNGMIFIQIDDNEYAYLKVMCDEVFDRKNYLNTIVVKAKAGAGASGGGEDKRLKKNYEMILIYVKSYEDVSYKIPIEKINLIDYITEHKENNVGFYYTRVITNYGTKRYLGEVQLGNGEYMKVYEHIGFEFSSVSKLSKKLNLSQEEVYNKYINDIFMVTNAQTSLLTRVNNFVKEKNKLISYEYVPTTGKMKGKLETKMVWNETLVVWLKDSALVEDGKVYKTEKTGTLWTNISWGRLDLEGGVNFKSGKKPESLIYRILDMATNEGDIVLDSFLGSGTTCAVAQKMNRKWIGIEMGKQCYTHCKNRLDKVIEGEQSGISREVCWNGGGGYKFYELAPSLLVKDKFGNWIISEEYDGNMLIQAICKQEKFDYIDNQEQYWKQGKSSEEDYIYVTTNYVSLEYLRTIHEEMKGNESLLICAKSYQSECEGKYDNITIKKIPQSILNNCEYGAENYNLNIVENDNESNEDECDE